MTKKDINETLIIPLCMFVIITVLAFGVCFISRDAKIDLVSGQQSFERFANNVESGKEQLTTERAIAIMRAKQVAIDSYLKAFMVERWLVQWIGWVSVIGIGMQAFIVFRIRKRMKKIDV